MAKAARTSQISELTKIGARVMRSEEHVVAAAIERDAIKSKYTALINQFLLTTAQTANLMGLPPAVIEAGIHYVAIAGKDPAVVLEWSAIAGLGGSAVTPMNTGSDALRTPGRRARTPGPGQVLVIVNVTKREGNESVPSLRSSNVKWNGKHNDFRGIVDKNEVDGLRVRFPNKVTVEGDVAQTSTVLDDQMMKGGAAADTNPLTTPGASSDSAFTNDEVLPPGQRDERLATEESQKQSTNATSGGPRDSVGPGNAAKPDTMLHAAKDDLPSRPKPYGGSPFGRLPVKPSPKVK
jgi:hypothetical protein